jgi:hypothetical protein
MARSDRTEVPAPAGIPNAPRIVHLAANAQRQEQTVAEFPDGTRVAVWVDGTVKVGRESDEPLAIEVDRTERGPGRGINGSRATAFVKLTWHAKTPRD